MTKKTATDSDRLRARLDRLEASAATTLAKLTALEEAQENTKSLAREEQIEELLERFTALNTEIIKLGGKPIKDTSTDTGKGIWDAFTETLGLNSEETPNEKTPDDED